MGQIPSRFAVEEPFYVDVKSAKTGWESLAALALTKHNFPSKEDPLFRKFLAVRSEPNIRYWFCNSEQPGDPCATVPDPPSAHEAYAEYVEGATAVVEQDLMPKDWVPIPILLFRLDKKDDKVPKADNCTCIGYFGIRSFDQEGRVIPNKGNLEIFLASGFQNESRALGIIQIAAKCYQRFSNYRGVRKVPWPRHILHRVPALNLPSLRLMQKFYYITAPFYQRSAEDADIEGDLCSMVQVQNGYITVCMCGSKIGDAAMFLCDKVPQKKGRKPGDPLVHFMRPEGLPAVPGVNNLLKIINDTVALAKDRWSDVNAIVLRQYAIEREDASAHSSDVSVDLSTSDGLLTTLGSMAGDDIVAPSERSLTARSSIARSGRWTHNPYATQSDVSSVHSLGSDAPRTHQKLPQIPNPSTPPAMDYELISSLPIIELPPVKLLYRNLFLAKNTPLRIPVNMVSCSSFLWADTQTPLRVAEWQAHCVHSLSLESSKDTVKLINQDFRTVEYELPTNLVSIAPGEWAIIRDGDTWKRVLMPHALAVK